MTDRVAIEGLRVDAFVGVYGHEYEVRQRLDVDVIIDAELTEAAASDDVSRTIDYDGVAQIVRGIVLGKHHRLIESIAQQIAERTLETFPARARRVTVRVHKPGAVPDAVNVSVEITRDRGRTRELQLGSHRLALGKKVHVMGVVNATPDSFYDRGRYFDAKDPGPAIARAEVLLDEGATIIDVGGETAQPGSPVLDAEEEIARVVPVIRALAARSAAPISVDTYKAPVARAALDAGALIINDTSGLADPTLATIAAERGAALVCMHITGHPKERRAPGYADPVGAITAWLAEKARAIEAAGVPRERVILDPGIGFAKTPRENLELTRSLRSICGLGYPVLYACSRRTFLGELMGGLPPEDRLEPTALVNTVAMLEGADLVRVHDVKFFARLTKMLEILRS